MIEDIETLHRGKGVFDFVPRRGNDYSLRVKFA